MKQFSEYLIALVLIISATTAIGQKTVSTSNQQWIQYYSNIKLSDKMALVSDYGLRTRENFSEWSQMLIRAGVSYKVHPDVKAVMGIAYLTFHQEGERVKTEWRPYQEFSTAQIFGKLKVHHRARIEERFFRLINENGNSSAFNFRFRYRILSTLPLIDLSEENAGGMLNLQVGNEFFLNAGSEIVYNQFDSNRILIGPSFQVSRELSFSLLYNYLYAQKNQPEAFSQTHVLWLGIKHSVEFD